MPIFSYLTLAQAVRALAQNGESLSSCFRRFPASSFVVVAVLLQATILTAR